MCFDSRQTDKSEMTDFDERSGIVPCQTPWGKWWQTIDDVFIEIPVAEGTRAKEIKVDFKPKFMKVTISGNVLIEGALFNYVHADDAIWTLEDKKFIRICLTKADRTAKNAWRSLLDGQHEADPATFDSMEKKLTLQRFQLENPGMDFSNADITGQYQGGGPELIYS